MQQLVSNKVITNAAITESKTNLNVPSTPKDQGNDDTEVLKASSSVIRPFQLSMCVSNLDSTHNFYNNTLGIEEQQAMKSSLHLDFMLVNPSFMN